MSRELSFEIDEKELERLRASHARMTSGPKPIELPFAYKITLTSDDGSRKLVGAAQGYCVDPYVLKQLPESAAREMYDSVDQLTHEVYEGVLMKDPPTDAIIYFLNPITFVEPFVKEGFEKATVTHEVIYMIRDEIQKSYHKRAAWVVAIEDVVSAFSKASTTYESSRSMLTNMNWDLISVYEMIKFRGRPYEETVWDWRNAPALHLFMCLRIENI